MQSPRFIYFLMIFIQISITNAAFAQLKFSDYYERLASAIISNDTSLINFTSSELKKISDRLGIEYSDVKNKFMISYEIDPNVTREINTEKIKFEYSVNQIDSVFKILKIEVPYYNYNKKYILKNDSLYSFVLFLTKDWTETESEHFRFLISNPLKINEYAIRKLEESYKIISTLFEFSTEQEECIKKNKILYILCSDEREVELLAGYAARGIYNLAYDAIITSYNSHYHELVHLLVNFKIKKNRLYTHPFFLEGIAAALGGRGGIHQRILLETGSFLYISGFTELEEIISFEDFRNTDPSISYALSGIYCYYLLHQVGIDSFLNIYKSYSGNSDEVSSMLVQINNLPSQNGMVEFIAEHFPKQISFENNINEEKVIVYSDGENLIFENESDYIFLLSSTLLLNSEFVYPDYKSTKIKELKLDSLYMNEHYLIICTESEISIYDLHLNMLINSYIQTLNFKYQPVPKKGNHYFFRIPKKYMKFVF